MTEFETIIHRDFKLVVVSDDKIICRDLKTNEQITVFHDLSGAIYAINQGWY